MDLLKDLLHQAGLRRRLLDLHQLLPDSAVRFPCSRSIGFHLIKRGPVWLHAPALAAPVELAAGDIAVMARGQDHLLATRATIAGLDVRLGSLLASDVTRADPAAGPSALSGAFQFWHEPVHPLFHELPPWFVLHSGQQPRLSPLALTASLLADETCQRALGSDAVIGGLLDSLFAYLLREMVQQRGATGSGWSHAVHDGPIGRVVALMHADCARAWKLDELAQAVGVSRTALAERFRSTMNDTPLNHLRTLRVQRAMALLVETDDKLEEVAAAVGYQDAFGFSKAFKRMTGVAPGDLRRRDRVERGAPWRFVS